MLRIRLFYGLLTLVLLLWGLGAAALMLLKDSDRRFIERLSKEYPPIRAAQSFRTITSTINTHYLASLAGDAPLPVLDRALYDKMKGELGAKLRNLGAASSKDANWGEVIDRLEVALDGYFESYEQFFTHPPDTPEARGKLQQTVSVQTQRITDLSENAMTLAEQKLFLGTEHIAAESAKNILFIVTLGLLGTAIAVIIYFQLVRHLVDPVAALQGSINEIRRGNFELAMVSPGYGNEFSSVIAAFNEMAAELRLRRGETDERLLKTNLVNRAILEAIPSPVYVLAEDGHVLQVNPAAEGLNESLGVDGRLPAKIQRIVEDCRENGSNHAPEDPREALLFRIDDREYYYLPRIFSFASEDGSRSGRAVLLHNVTRIRWLDDMKTNLLSTVSHEIKTPLTGIRMVLHLLQEDRPGSLNPAQRTMIHSASDDCERLLGTLNTLLDLSRAESGTTHLDREPVDLCAALERAARLFEAKAREKDVTIQLEAEPGLPEVMADPRRLDEVINNLVSNALKHSPRGGRITLRVDNFHPEALRASVIDQGPGVPESCQDRIFERFFRAPGQEADGVGLGLFISREIMRAHEGRIGLRERAHDQTEFFIDVPLA